MVRTTKRTKIVNGQRGHHVTHLHACLDATQVSVRLAPVQDSFDSSTRRIGVASRVLRFRVRSQLFQSRCLSILLAKSSCVYLLFPRRGHKPPPTFRDCLNPHLCLQRRRFPVPRCVKRPDVALYVIGSLFLIPTPSSPHCTLKVSEHDSLWQPPDAHSDKRPRPQKSSRAQRFVDAFIRGYLMDTIVRGHPMGLLLRYAPMMRSKTRRCTVRSLDQFNDWRGCNKCVPFLVGNSTKIAPTGDIFDQPPGQM